MKEIIAILAIVGLLVFGAYMVAEGLNSAALSFAEAQRHQAYATVAVAQIEAQTQIRLQELQMLENAYTRGMFAVMFWPVVTLLVFVLAAGVWLAVWRELRRPANGYSQQQQLPDTWRPALESRNYTRFEWETMQQEANYWENRR